MNRANVLFLCTGNTARSQMAEALLRHRADDRFQVFSAGLEPSRINPYTLRVLEEAGIDTEGQYSKGLMEYMGKIHFGYLVTVCGDAEAKCPTTFPGVGRRLHWPFEDPAAVEGSDEEKLEAFRRIRDRIDEKIRSWLREQGISPES